MAGLTVPSVGVPLQPTDPPTELAELPPAEAPPSVPKVLPPIELPEPPPSADEPPDAILPPIALVSPELGTPAQALIQKMTASLLNRKRRTAMGAA